jgi:hypothetical protein
MSEHLSSLVLDELATGLEVSVARREHANQCRDCRARLDRIVAAREQASSAPPFAQVLERLRRAPRPAPSRRSLRWALLFAPVLAAAAALVLLVNRAPLRQPDRIKGPASLRVVGADGQSPAAFRAGDRVRLSVGGAGLPYAAVMAIDERGAISALWPPNAAASGEIAPGAEVLLAPGFEVTSGSIALHAFFSERPLRFADAREALERGLTAAHASGSSPLQALPAALNGEGARASALLQVSREEAPR